MQKFTPGQVVVRLADSNLRDAFAEKLQVLSEVSIIDEYGGKSILLRVPDGKEQEVANTLKTFDEVKVAEPNGLVWLPDPRISPSYYDPNE